jgi:hypothetical protein
LEELKAKLEAASKERNDLKQQMEVTTKCNESSEQTYSALIKEHETLTEEKAMLEMDFVAIQDKNHSIVLGMREKSEKLEAEILMRNQQIDALKTEKGESEVISTNLRGIRRRKVFSCTLSVVFPCSRVYLMRLFVSDV